MLDMRMCAVGACVLCQPHPTLGNVGGHALYAADNSSCVLGLLCVFISFQVWYQKYPGVCFFGPRSGAGLHGSRRECRC